jgi:hypothetical protein
MGGGPVRRRMRRGVGPADDQDTVTTGVGDTWSEQGKLGVADMRAMATVTGGPVNGIQTHSNQFKYFKPFKLHSIQKGPSRTHKI